MGALILFSVFVLGVVTLDLLVGIITPYWMGVAVLVVYAIILTLEFDNIRNYIKGGYTWLLNKLERYNSEL